jgi:hypothetical protein
MKKIAMLLAVVFCASLVAYAVPSTTPADTKVTTKKVLKVKKMKKEHKADKSLAPVKK